LPTTLSVPSPILQQGANEFASRYLAYSMFRAQVSSHEREIDFHVSLK
jgi:hypothetical protein